MTGLTGYTYDWFAVLDATSPADFWNKWNPGLHNSHLKFLIWARRRINSRHLMLPVSGLIFIFNGVWHDFFLVFIPGLILGINFGLPFVTFFTLQFIITSLERVCGIRCPRVPAFIKTVLTFALIFTSLAASFMINFYVFG